MAKKIFFLTSPRVAHDVGRLLAQAGLDASLLLAIADETEEQRPLAEEWAASSGQHEIDLVVVDLDLLAQREETEVMQQIVNSQPEAWIICLTEKGVNRECCPAQFYLKKPFRESELAELIACMLRL